MKKRKKVPPYCEEGLGSGRCGALSKDGVIRLMISDSCVDMHELENAKQSDIDKYAYMIINTENFGDKYAYLLSQFSLSLKFSFYQIFVRDADEKCFESYVLMVKEDVDSFYKSRERWGMKKADVWTIVGDGYRFSFVVSLLIEQKKENLLRILLKHYDLTSGQECLLLSSYVFYEDSDFLKSYFSKNVLWPATFNKLCDYSYNSLYKLYYEANHGKVPLKYRLIRLLKALKHLCLQIKNDSFL